MEQLGFDPNAPAIGQGKFKGDSSTHWQLKPDLSTPAPATIGSGARLEILDLAPGFALARSNRVAGWLPLEQVEIKGGLQALEKSLPAAREQRDRTTRIAERRSAAFEQAKRECPLPVQFERVTLPGGLQLFDDEFVVTVGSDWGWSSQKLTLTTRRVVYSRGRLSKDQESVYLTDVRDVSFHKPMLGFGTLALETAGGHSIEGLPAASNGVAIRDKLLALIHYARQAAAGPAQAAAVAVAAPPPDKYEQLKKLGELKAQGILTEEEFAAEKQKLLSS